jgi:hypothetical protein
VCACVLLCVCVCVCVRFTRFKFCCGVAPRCPRGHAPLCATPVNTSEEISRISLFFYKDLLVTITSNLVKHDY